MLAESDEITGLGIYAEFALNRFFTSAATLKNNSNSGRQPAILFLCFEDFLNPANEPRILNQTDHFFGMPPRKATAAPSTRQFNYTGGHSTPHNRALRDRLRLEVARIDIKWLGGALLKINKMFQCGAPSTG
jgi:hypothetical protein